MDNSVKHARLSTEASGWDDCVLLVFAKQPIVGQVKTRLTPPLSAEQATTFYALSQRQTLESLRMAPFKAVLCYSGERDYFSHTFPGLPLLEQGEGDLGERLKRVFHVMRSSGWRRICVIGTDSPDLPLQMICSAFECLAETDFVTIPARDGGYVLAGSRCCCSAAFEEIRWSTEQVLEQTRQQLQSAGLSYQQLATWEDIDDIGAMRRFVQRSPDGRCGRYAKRCLRTLELNS